MPVARWKLAVVLSVGCLTGCSQAEKIISRMIDPVEIETHRTFANSLNPSRRKPIVEGFACVPKSSGSEARVINDPKDRPSGFRLAPNAVVTVTQSGRSTTSSAEGYFVIENPLEPMGRLQRAPVTLSVTENGVTYTASRESDLGFTLGLGEGFVKSQLDADLDKALEKDTSLESGRIVLAVRNGSPDLAYGRLALGLNGDHTTWEQVAADQQSTVVLLDRPATEVAAGENKVIDYSMNSDTVRDFNSRIWTSLRQNKTQPLWGYFDGSAGQVLFTRVMIELKFKINL